MVEKIGKLTEPSQKDTQFNIIKYFAKRGNISYEDAWERTKQAIQELKYIKVPTWFTVDILAALEEKSELAYEHLWDIIFYDAISYLGIPLSDGDTFRLRIQILQEPLTATTLATVLSGLTDLYIRCFLIQQKQLEELIEYDSQPNPQFLKDRQLFIGAMSHNSPAIIDVIVTTVGTFGGTAGIVLALKNTIDTLAQAPLRYQAEKLKNEEKEVEIQQARNDMDFTEKRREQELQDKAFDFNEKRLRFLLETAPKLVDLLQTDLDSGQKELVSHLLLPPLKQLAAVRGLETVSVVTDPPKLGRSSALEV